MKREDLKRIIESNKVLYIPLRFYRIIRYYWFQIMRLKFQQIFCRKNYKKLKALEGSCSGRCFIIGTGPSMTIDDLKRLKNEVTFGVNGLCKVFQEAGVTTSYFGFQDSAVYRESWKIILSLDASRVFYNQNVLYELGKKKFPVWKDAVCFYNYPGKHFLDYGIDLNTKFSERVDKIVYDGYTILYSLLQIAVYMGFTEIYLLGADCNYNPDEKMHFVDSPNDRNKNSPTFKNNAGGRAMMECYKIAKKYADEHGIKIYNATRGGKLEVFERVNLDEVLSKSANNT